MNENNLFDDISRTLASPIPRRQAFGHILRGIAGAALVSVFGFGTARAATKCPPGQPLCGRRVARTATSAVVTPPAAFPARAATAKSARPVYRQAHW